MTDSPTWEGTAPVSVAPTTPSTPNDAPTWEGTENLEDKYGGPFGAITTAASHLVNTTLPGIGPVLQDAVGLPYETQKNLTEANPTSAIIGDLGGFAKGVGVPGLISSAGKSVGSLSTGLAGKALQFGTEGALVGASNAVNDLALGDPNLTAQKALTDIGFGAAMGIAAAPIAQAAQTLLPKAAKGLSKSLGKLQESVLGTAEEPTVVAKAIGGAGSILNGKSPELNVNALFAGVNAGETTLPKVAEHLSAVTEHGSKATEELENALQSQWQDEGYSISHSKLGNGNSFVEAKDINGNHVGAGEFFPMHDAEADAEFLHPNQVYVEDAHQRKGIASGMYKAAEDATGLKISPSPKQTEIGSLFSKGRVENIASDLMARNLIFDFRASENEFQKEFMNAAKTKIDPGKLEMAFTDPGKRELLDTYISNTKRVLDASENYANYKQAETSISKFVNSIASKNAEMDEVLKSMTGDSKFVKDATIAAGAHMLGVSNPMVAAGLSAVEAYRMAKNPYETGKALNAAFQKIKAFAEINEKITEKIGSLSKGVFSNAAIRNTAIPHATPLALPAMATQKGYDNKVNRISELASNPQMLEDHLAMHTEDLYQAAPNVSAGLHAGMLSGVQFLASKIPRPSSQMVLSHDWKPSQSQKQAFMTYYRAVNEPLSALKDIKNGTLSMQTMEALKATKPHLLQEMRSKVMENLNPVKAKNLPYRVKLSLSKFMGEPMVESLIPSVMMSNQMSFIGPQQSEQNAPKQSRVTSGGMKAIDLANRSETETQAHEKEDV